MYVTAMWLRSLKDGDTGVNIFVHLHPGGLRARPDEIAENPGPDERSLSRIQLPPGANRVDAYLDVVLEDGPEASRKIQAAIKAMAEHADKPGVNPVQYSMDGVWLSFYLDPALESVVSKAGIYQKLRKNLESWLDAHALTLNRTTLPKAVGA